MIERMPTRLPDLTVASLAEWIERVRNAAFFSGARGEEINRAEAMALLPVFAHFIMAEPRTWLEVREIVDAIRAAAPPPPISRSGIPITRRKV